MLLSTCNRVEVVALTRSADAARLRLRSFFRRELGAEPAGLRSAALDEALYEYRDGEAMRHVLRVASALDSMVVGEPQILGQTKDAYRAAVECGASGPILDRLYQRAFATAKRVRSDTRIAEGPLSVARVAVALARQIFEDMHGQARAADRRGRDGGAGARRRCATPGVASLAVANRSAERAAQLAVRLRRHRARARRAAAPARRVGRGADVDRRRSPDPARRHARAARCARGAAGRSS